MDDAVLRTVRAVLVDGVIGGAVGACMRKLVMICYGVLKNRTPFDPNWASRKTS